jgi:hypothetical protein
MTVPTGRADAAPARECGDCSLCCKLLGIEELGKPQGQWCPHCVKPNGCAIYDQRPQECRDFSCGWLESSSLGPEWQPSRCKIVLYVSEDGARMIAQVDLGTPNAWREEPYYRQLKAWARQWIKTGPNVVVRIGSRVVVVLPDRDVDLGRVAKGEKIFIGERMTTAGPRYVAEKIAGEVN